MEPQPVRRYHSPARQRQALATRRRIADAARRLFLGDGYADTTVQGIALAADVAPQTVYAVFGSKSGILAELLERAAFGPTYEELVKQANETPEPAARLHVVAQIARKIFDSIRAEMQLLRHASALAPELAELERRSEHRRFEGQAPVIAYLVEVRALRSGLDEAAARDILWSLTGQDLYRMLVVERGWASDRYGRWLGDLLVAALLDFPA